MYTSINPIYLTHHLNITTMKTLRNNSEVAHSFAHQQHSAAKGSNLFYINDTIYSYGYHFAIAKLINGKALLTNRSYSVSTRKHIRLVWNAVYVRRNPKLFITILNNKTMENLTLGENVNIIAYHTKQKGYGRQSLYVNLIRTDIPYNPEKSFITDVYVMDVYPNVLEHFESSYYLREHAIHDKARGVYTRESGDGEYTDEDLFNNMNELLNHALRGHEFEL